MPPRRPAAPPAPSPSATRIPRAAAVSLFGVGLAGLNLIWLPLAVLHQVDGLLAFSTWRELGLDIALLAVLMATVAAVLSAAALGCGAALRRLGLRAEVAGGVAWCIVVVPVALLCAMEFTASLKHWVELTLGGPRWATNSTLRTTLVLLSPLLVYALWRSAGTARLVHWVVEPLYSLRHTALAASALAAALLAWQPPVFLGRSGDDPALRRPAAPGMPDIYILSMDTLAFEDAGWCGSGPSSMPRLRQLAARSSCFTRYYAASNVTRPTTSTMDTATLPWTHWAVNLGGPIAEPVRASSLGHALQQAGYSTHFIGAVLQASPRQHGTYRGYDTVELVASTSPRALLSDLISVFPDSSIPVFIYLVSSSLETLDIRLLNRERHPYPPQRVYEPAAALLQRLGWAQPVFMWLHTMPPHSPYLPPPSTKYKLLPAGELDRWQDFLGDTQGYASTRQAAVDKQRLRYRETILGADEKLGDFLDSLEISGRLDSALVVVTTDHGESFERGWLGHGGEALHEAVIRIPLLIKLPGQRLAQTISLPVSQADLAPTLLDLVVPGRQLPLSDGRSLRPLLAGESLAPAPVFSMAMQRESRFRPIRGGDYAVIDDHHKLVYHLAQDSAELYDLRTDPQERTDLSQQQPAQAQRLRTLLGQRIASAEAQRQRWFGR